MPARCSTGSSKGAAGRQELASGEVVRQWFNKHHGRVDRPLGLRLHTEKHGLWSGFQHGNTETALGAADGQEVHSGEAGVASAGRVARACGSVNDCALEVGLALACLGGKDALDGGVSAAVNRIEIRGGAMERTPRRQDWVVCVGEVVIL